MTEMYEWWNKLPFKYCILINACAPFLKVKTVEDFAKKYMQSKSDGMFGVIEKKNYFAKWTDRPIPTWYVEGLNNYNANLSIS